MSVAEKLVGLRLLGTSGAALYAVVDELVTDSSGAFLIDEVVRRYSADGTLLGLARFPLGSQYTAVDHPFAIAPDGSVHSLLTTKDGAQVVRLTFSATLARILPANQTPPITVPSTATPCISRSAIADAASAYLSNSKPLSASALDGPCPGRGKPHYLRGPATYGSVPYDWGGWVTVARFNADIDQGRQAGDVDTSSSEGCSRGVDCSGFVTRVWGRTDRKYFTWTLHEISYVLRGPWALRQGDVMNRPRQHVRLIDYVDGNGAVVWESTTNGNRDRVVHRYVPWSNFYSYQPRRYNYLCDP